MQRLKNKIIRKKQVHQEIQSLENELQVNHYKMNTILEDNKRIMFLISNKLKEASRLETSLEKAFPEQC